MKPFSVHENTPRFILRLIIWSVVINYVWEILQMPLYEGMRFSDPRTWLICFRASLGDGVIILGIWGFGLLIFHDTSWFKRKQFTTIIVLVLSGAVIAIGFEIFAIKTGRWQYSEYMPLILGIGLSPLIQLLVLPWISMMLACRIPRRVESDLV